VLKAKALSATLWSGADIFLRQGLQFAVSIALARLLSPEAFGTIALLYLFVGIASAFVDSGFASALVQRRDVTHADESTVFWFNLIAGAVMAAGLWAAAPAIAGFYALPLLTPLTRLMAVNVWVSSMGSIHGTLLVKNLEFRTQMKIGAIAAVLSGAVAVAMAWKGFGVWALAAQVLSSTIVTTVLLWVCHPWRPAATFSLASARRLFGFGGYLLASGLLDIIYTRGYTVLIGKLYSIRDLGFYNRADGTKQLPVGILTGVVGRVAFPIFSAAADDAARLRQGVRLAVRGMMLVNVPMMLGLAAVARPLVLTLLGPQWLPAVPMLQVLCLAGVFWPLHVINLNVLMAQGHSRLFFRLEVVKKLLGLVLLLAGALFGVMGIAWSQVVFGGVGFTINAYYTSRHLGYGAVEQTRDTLPVIAIALPMAAGVYWAGDLAAGLSPIAALLWQTVLGAVFFLGAGWVSRLAALQDALHLIRPPRPAAPQVSAA
jgi:O-antigen/teichoic acid export membrane protein